MNSSDQAILAEIARTARASLVFALDSARRCPSDSGVAGACLHGSVLVCLMASRWWGGLVLVRGGDGMRDGGYVDGRGERHGHYWAEACRDNASWVIDITADQFGDEQIAVLPLSASTVRYQPGNQDVVDAAVAEMCADFGIPALGPRPN